MSTIILVGHGLIGKKIREGLIENGHQVLVLDINKPSGDIDFIQMDINSESSVDTAIEEIRKRKIKATALINTSYPRTPSYGRKLEDVTLHSFNENVNSHLGGYFNIMKKFGFYFKEEGGGAVISFSSIYGVASPRFEIYNDMKFTLPVEYSAVKSAILHLNGYFAKYFKGHNVRFNSISPGGVYDSHDPKFVEAYGRHSLSARAGMILPDDLVAAAVFLSSAGAHAINGQNLVVDEGWTL